MALPVFGLEGLGRREDPGWHQDHSPFSRKAKVWIPRAEMMGTDTSCFPSGGNRTGCAEDVTGRGHLGHWEPECRAEEGSRASTGSRACRSFLRQPVDGLFGMRRQQRASRQD